MHPRHLAFPVTDLSATRHIMICCRTRSDRWTDFDSCGHPITTQLSDTAAAPVTNPVDSESVPFRHFGVILDVPARQDLSERLEANGVKFHIRPQIRFAGQSGAQATLLSRARALTT